MTFGEVRRQTALCSTEKILRFIVCNHGQLEDTRPHKAVLKPKKALSLCHFLLRGSAILYGQMEAKESRLFQFLIAFIQSP